MTTRGTGTWSALTSPLPTVTTVAAPAAFAASGARGVVNLRWAATSGATSYLVRVRAAKATSWTSTVVTGTSVAIPRLKPGARTRFAVAALTAAGIGRFTATAAAAPGRVPAASPRGLLCHER